MKRKTLALLLVLPALLMLLAAPASAEDKCPVCGMSIAGNENTAFLVTMKAGGDVTYCCAHCGLWAMANEKDKVQSGKTRDLISGEWVDAAKAVYLSKSKAVPACSPSWLSFGSKKEAELFKKGFGGTIYGYEKALEVRAKEAKGMETSK